MSDRIPRAADLFAKAQDKYAISSSDWIRGLAYWFNKPNSDTHTKRIYDALISVAELIEGGGD